MRNKVNLVRSFALVMTLSITLTVCPAEAQSQRFKITSETGVPDDAKENAQTAVDATLGFFKETYHLELKKDYRIILVPNRESYAAALVREAKVDQKEAERRARTTLGWSTYDVIIQNAGEMKVPRRRVYNMSHEVVHKFQSEECSGNCQKIMWTYEGFATAIGSRIVEILGMRPLDETKKTWLKDLQKISTRPSLKELKSKEDWYKALDKFGSDPTYGMVGLAVLNLIEQKGYHPWSVYFKKLNDWSGEDSFKMALGLDMNSYENEFGSWIEKEMSKIAGE